MDNRAKGNPFARRSKLLKMPRKGIQEDRETYSCGEKMNCRTISLIVSTAASTMLLAACMNMPTQTSQITGSHTSGLKYEEYGCSKLAGELDSLARRENQLVIAQEQRIKTSQMQAFWWGFGQGDGIEASELANVRGEKEAVRGAMDAKKCK